MRFFPDPSFGWIFLALLGSALALASYLDLRDLVVPKWLTLPLAGAGLLVSVLRGAWLGAQGNKVWLFENPNLVLGMVDGLLFAVAGFAFGFAIYFVMWMLGICGGGDVKLFAAVSAWLGPLYLVYLLMATTVAVFVFAIVRVAWNIARGQAQLRLAMVAARTSASAAPGTRARKSALSFSLPLAIATICVTLWVFRVDLRLQAPPANSNAKVEAHVRQAR